MARKGFVPDHYQQPRPTPEVDTTAIHDEDPSALFAFGEAPSAKGVVTSIADALPALQGMMDMYNAQSRKKGIADIFYVPGNRFVESYDDPDDVADQQAAKVAFLEQKQVPLTETLNRTNELVAAGFSHDLAQFATRRALEFLQDTYGPGGEKSERRKKFIRRISRLAGK